MRLSLVTGLLVCAAAMAQVSVVESGTRAELVDGHTSISLALNNSAPKAIETRTQLRWLNPKGRVDGTAERTLLVKPGNSRLVVPLPLGETVNSFTERLEYTVSPGAGASTSFTPASDTLSFTSLCGYLFTLDAYWVGTPRPGIPFEIRFLATHPLTGQPARGVRVELEQQRTPVVTGADGIALFRITREDEEAFSLDATGSVGDISVSTSIRLSPQTHGDVHAFTDKPLYQPGQTMHIRMLGRDGAGKAKADASYVLRVDSPTGDHVHTVNLTTSRFGVSSTDWEIPDDAESGRYTIEIQSDELPDVYRQEVQVRKYELPSFSVVVKPSRSYYLPGKKAEIIVSAEYLFGKPVAMGTARISQLDENVQNDEPADEDNAPLIEGKLDANGVFRASLDTGDEISEGSSFEDRRFVAFVTDVTTGRTEQRKFVLRVTRDPIHIYIPRQEADSAGRRIYITTFSPDGVPLPSQVELLRGGVVMVRGRSNRYGVARLDLPLAADESEADAVANSGGFAPHSWEVRAIAPGGLQAHTVLHFDQPRPGFWLRTDRTLYLAGSGVKVTLGTSRSAATALLVASNERSEVVFATTLRLKGGSTEVVIPYSRRFGRVLSITLAVPSGFLDPGRTVYFPGPGDFTVNAASGKSTYLPGETAALEFHASTRAALGIAIVDDSVFARASTDQMSRDPEWSEQQQQGNSLGVLTERALRSIPSARIDGDLQLAAELLAPVHPVLLGQHDDPLHKALSAYWDAGAAAVAPVMEVLRRHSLAAEEYPRDEAAFRRIAGSQLDTLRDPWQQPFYLEFSIHSREAGIRILSSGPDKVRGTADDYRVASVEQDWFAHQESLIQRALKGDCPATPSAFTTALDAAGIQFDRLRDPWGTGLRIAIQHFGPRRSINIESAGPDRQFGTADDFTVMQISGNYFSVHQERIEQILSQARDFPINEAEFRSVLARASFDFDSLRDPWDRAYEVVFREETIYSSTVQVYTLAEYEHSSEERKRGTVAKLVRRIIEVRSQGEHPGASPHEGFGVATFERMLPLGAPPGLDLPQLSAQSLTGGGNGSMEGVATDRTGDVLPDVEVRLTKDRVTRTSANGRFTFRDLPAGVYRLTAQATGFKTAVIEAIPVYAGGVTTLSVMLWLGQITDSVEVTAEAPLLSTASASVAVARGVALGSATALSTPRVRDYFPETLYWQPELVTDSNGHAKVTVKLADSVTTWHVAVMASTLDGRIAEGSADVRAFQPFIADLDVPPTLTTSDEISLPMPVRNYLDRAQKVSVTVKTPPELRLMRPASQPGTVEPSSSRNAVLDLRAEAASAAAKLRVSAIGSAASDAIEKPIAIHPDGELRFFSRTGVIESGAPIEIAIPQNATAGSVNGKMKIYPSLLARVLESIEALLVQPHGCAEQTISSTYPNLLLLTALDEAEITDLKLTARAKKNLLAGYRRLIGYQAGDGGFSYWGHGESDAALTAYALAFLADAAKYTEVDEDRVKRAQTWLAGKGSNEASVEGWRLRVLAGSNLLSAGDIDLQLGALARKAAEYSDPYALATYALAAMEAGKPALAGPVIAQLMTMARDEQGAAWWDLEANTPFHGWGRWGQVETTAMVVSAFARWRKTGHSDPALDRLIDRGGLFLVRSVDSNGVWATGQASVRALTALLDSWNRATDSPAAQVEVRVNGSVAGKLAVPAGRSVGAPLVVDVGRFLRAGSNQVTVAGLSSRAQQVQAIASWYEPWIAKRAAKELDLKVSFSSVSPAVLDAIECKVVVSRPSFGGYGMVIAEVGLPPGAEVDRGSLEELIKDWKQGIDRYEVAPGKVIFYLWPSAADSKFRFLFRPRWAMTAKAEASLAYDYYNPDERVVLIPERFTVKP